MATIVLSALPCAPRHGETCGFEGRYCGVPFAGTMRFASRPRPPSADAAVRRARTPRLPTIPSPRRCP
jgi:hypothetical protein